VKSSTLLFVLILEVNSGVINVLEAQWYWQKPLPRAAMKSHVVTLYLYGREEDGGGAMKKRMVHRRGKGAVI
jgi:hypothetical protein